MPSEERERRSTSNRRSTRMPSEERERRSTSNRRSTKMPSEERERRSTSNRRGTKMPSEERERRSTSNLRSTRTMARSKDRETKSKKDRNAKSKDKETKSKKRRPKSRDRGGINCTFDSIKTSVAHVEEKLDKEFVNRIFTDQVLADAEQYGKKIARAVNSTVKSVSEHRCDLDNDAQTVLTDMHSVYSKHSKQSRFGITSSAQLSDIATTSIKTRFMDETDDRRSQISSYVKSSIAKSNEEELKRLQSELKSASASFVKMEADKIAMKDKHSKEIKNLLAEKKKAEKKFQDEKEEFQETIEGQKAKMNKLSEDASRLKRKLMATKHITTLTEDTQQLSSENEAMTKQIAKNMIKIKNLQLQASKKDSELEKKDEEINNLRAKLELNGNSTIEQKLLQEKITGLKKLSREQKQKIEKLNKEHSELQEKIKSSNETKELKRKENPKQNQLTEKTLSTVKTLVQSLMKEIQTLTLENGALYKELYRRDSSTVTTDPSTSIESSHRPYFTIHAEVEKEVESLQQHIITTINNSGRQHAKEDPKSKNVVKTKTPNTIKTNAEKLKPEKLKPFEKRSDLPEFARNLAPSFDEGIRTPPVNQEGQKKELISREKKEISVR